MSYHSNSSTLSRQEKYRWVKYGGYHPIVWFLIIGTAITRLASFMSLPFLAIHLSQSLHLDPFSVGITLGMSGLTGSLGGFVGGYLSDRWGRQRIMVFSFLVWIGVFFGFMFAESFWDFFLLNSLNGLCRAFFEPTSQALMADVSTPEQRLKIFSYRYIAINIGMVAGPLLGSLLYNTLGMTIFLYTGIIYTLYFLSLSTFLLRYRRDLPKVQGPEANTVPFRECWKVIRRDRALRYFVLAGILFFIVYSQIESSLPLYLVEQAGTADHLYPLLLTMNAAMVILLQYFATRWAEKKHILTSLFIGCLLSVGGFLSFAVGSQDTAFITGVVLITLGEILIFPVSSLFIDRIAKDRMRGTYYGANNLGQLGLFFGPMIGGGLLDHMKGPAMWWLMAFMTLHLIFFHALGYRAYGKKQGVTILEIVRRVFVDLRLVSPIKTVFKLIPWVSLITLCTLLPYPLFEKGLQAPPRSNVVKVHIPKHTTIGDIGLELESRQVIHNRLLFPLYATSYSVFHPFDFQPGTYRIQPEMSLKEVMSVLSQGTFKVKIPEGATVEQIAEILEPHGISKKEFYRAANQTKFDYSFLQEIPHQRPYPLEGYLMPGVYEFNKKTKAEDILHVMLDRFDRKMTSEVRLRLREGNLTVDQWVTIASIIEWQTKNRGQKPFQARKIYDRLNQGIDLQLPPAPPPYSGFKSYQNGPGLPPGPLNNPGIESLMAALYPAKAQTNGTEHP